MSKRQAPREYGASTTNAFTAIRDLIVHGRLAPGSWAVESDLCKELGMSRTPVRAALQWLQYEGYLLSQGTGFKSRMIVAPLTVQDAQELYRIVGYIEGIGGRLAANLPDEKRTELVAKLRKLHDRLEAAARSSKFTAEEFVDLDTTFHDCIVEAGAGPRLLSIYNAIKPQTERYWRIYSSSILSSLKESCDEHARIIDAIDRGSGGETERALRSNWENGATRLANAICTSGERGNWSAHAGKPKPSQRMPARAVKPQS